MLKLRQAALLLVLTCFLMVVIFAIITTTSSAQRSITARDDDADTHHIVFGADTEIPFAGTIGRETQFEGLAPCPLAVLPHDGSATAIPKMPSIRFANSRAVYLIRASELAAAGYQSGSSPTVIAWNYHTAPGSSGTAPLKIYLQNTTDTTNNKGTSFSAAIVGMPIVYNAPATLPATAGIFGVNLVPGFVYTGGGLYIAYDWGQYTGGMSFTVKGYSTTNLSNGAAGANSNTDTLTFSSFRPETRLNGSPGPQNDLAVSALYTLGEIPVGRVSSAPIQALITNNGPQTLTNVPVTLNVSGGHTFSGVQTIPTLGPCGSQQLVTFNGFAPSTMGDDTLTVSVPADDVSANNSQSKTLNVTANDYNYASPASPPASSVGFFETGIFAAKFTTTSVASVEAVTLNFPIGEGQPYRISMYRDNGGVPYEYPIYSEYEDRTVPGPGPFTVLLNSPVTVGQIFYVGVEQTTPASFLLAYDREIPLRTGTFFESFSLQPTVTWQDLSPSHFGLSIGVVLNTVLPPTPSPSPGSPGALDGTFGNAGMVTTQTGTGDYYGAANSVMVQPDGKIVLAGLERSAGYAVVRYNPDGSLDPSFGSGGKVTTSGGFGYSAALQRDGKIIVAGYGGTTQQSFSLARFNSNGSLDSSFGNGGKVTTPILSSAIGLSVALQPDGKIVEAGLAADPQSGNPAEYIALARYNTNGSLDSAFGTGGKLTTAIGTNDVAASVAIQQDGKLVVGGYSDSGTG
jgi:uncharacterized delta-60 repeat protein